MPYFQKETSVLQRFTSPNKYWGSKKKKLMSNFFKMINYFLKKKVNKHQS